MRDALSSSIIPSSDTVLLNRRLYCLNIIVPHAIIIYLYVYFLFTIAYSVRDLNSFMLYVHFVPISPLENKYILNHVLSETRSSGSLL